MRGRGNISFCTAIGHPLEGRNPLQNGVSLGATGLNVSVRTKKWFVHRHRRRVAFELSDRAVDNEIWIINGKTKHETNMENQNEHSTRE